jgi:type IV secretory pathway VirB10-like protein
VFQARFGFHDSVVAAPSQAAALRAWGIRQNLFAEGQARITDDPQAVEAARAHPETPLRRIAGSNDPFELNPTALPKVPDAPKRPGAQAAKAPRPEPAKPLADRSQLDAAEAALHAVDERRKREEARLRDKQDALEQEMADRQAAYVASRKAASAAVGAARQAYRKAGGLD